ncbi:MAG: hypothetical protein H0U66_04395 [Gemmatimonadaceae bacterium]|nr:hypothetical protein [Gemmatimonadaceae bacterium]
MTGGSVDSATPSRSRLGAWSARDEQWKRKIAAILVAFAFGFLLAWFLKKCPQLGGGGGGGGGGGSISSGGGHGGNGSPAHFGQGGGSPGGGGGGGGANSVIQGGGGKLEGHDGDGDVAGGKSPGGKPGGGDPPPPTAGDGDANAGDAIIKSAEGRMETGNAKVDTTPAGPPPPNLQMAHDFSFDSTGLPRYSSNVTSVASGISTDTLRHKKSTLASIVTTDSFDSVVAWYKGKVPAGWRSSQVGDMEAMSKALSPDAIKNMISGALSGGPVDTASVTAAQKGHGTGVAIFTPPNQTVDARGIMVMTTPGKPVQVMMTKKLQQ